MCILQGNFVVTNTMLEKNIRLSWWTQNRRMLFPERGDGISQGFQKKQSEQIIFFEFFSKNYPPHEEGGDYSEILGAPN